MSEELERFLRQMDQDMLVYGESACHVTVTPELSTEIRVIAPTTRYNGVTAHHIMSDEAGPVTPTLLEAASIGTGSYIIPEMGTGEGLEAQINNATRYDYNSNLTEQDFSRAMEQLVQREIDQRLERVVYFGSPTYTYEYNFGTDGTVQDIKLLGSMTHKSPIHNYEIKEDRRDTTVKGNIWLSVKTPTREYGIQCTKLDYQLRLTQAKGGSFKNWDSGKV